MEFIETPLFTRLVNKLLDDDEYRELQEVLIYRPDLGDLIQGHGRIAKNSLDAQRQGQAEWCQGNLLLAHG